MRLGTRSKMLLLATVVAAACGGLTSGGARAGTTALGGTAGGGWDPSGWYIDWTTAGSVDGAAVSGDIVCTGTPPGVYAARLSCAGARVTFEVDHLAIVETTLVADPASGSTDEYTTWLLTGTSQGADFRCAGPGNRDWTEGSHMFDGACTLSASAATSQHVDLPRPLNSSVDVGPSGASACRTSGPVATGCANVAGAGSTASAQGPAGSSAVAGLDGASVCRSGGDVYGCPTGGFLDGPGFHWHNFTGLVVCTPGGRACAGDYFVFPFPTKTIERGGVRIVTGPDGAEICATRAGATGCTGTQPTSSHVDPPAVGSGTSLAGKATGQDEYSEFIGHNLWLSMDLNGTYQGQPVVSSYQCHWVDPNMEMSGGTMSCAATPSPVGSPPASFTVTNVREDPGATPTLQGDVFTSQHLVCDLASTPFVTEDPLSPESFQLWGACTVS